MYLSGIVYESVVDGEGFRNVLFISGCKHYCEGCHNPSTWSFTRGEPFTLEKQIQFIQECERNPLIDGITLSGGDPFFSALEVIEFVKLYKSKLPGHTIWIYSGFTYEEILKDATKKQLLDLCDVLVDGKFDKNCQYPLKPFRGSANQRIIYLKED